MVFFLIVLSARSENLQIHTLLAGLLELFDILIAGFFIITFLLLFVLSLSFFVSLYFAISVW